MTILRCAIYTRKSTEEGLEQDFNSLDAQREACEAFVASQAGLGWKALKERYDDGGISGGTMERPALMRLLEHVAAGSVDVVLVYKIDRLTRSLTDFSRIVEVFEKREVSFVSVTQQFNTTTSMGRLTLNVLLSFAQFEREVTAERIRDKIAASKRKGMWMGGPVPLGYVLRERKLLVDEEEAQTIRWLFEHYLELGSVPRLKRLADNTGVTSKIRIRSDGSKAGGRPLSRGNLYLILRNPLYAGLVGHKGELHAGQHEGIIDRAIWDAVQAALDSNGRYKGRGNREGSTALLFGLLFDPQGDRLTPTHAVKRGVKYRYYVSNRLLKGEGNDGEGIRLSANKVEGAVVEGLQRWLLDPMRVLEEIASPQATVTDQRQFVSRAADLAKHFAIPKNGAPTPEPPLARLIERATIHDDRIALTLQRSGLIAALGCASKEGPAQDVSEYLDNRPPLTLDIPLTLSRRGRSARLVLNDTDAGNAKVNAPLVRLIATAHRRFAALAAGEASSTGELARQEATDPSELSRTIQLASLAPDIVEKILLGQQPIDLTATRLKKLRDLPLGWPEQRKLLGFVA